MCVCGFVGLWVSGKLGVSALRTELRTLRVVASAVSEDLAYILSEPDHTLALGGLSRASSWINSSNCRSSPVDAWRPQL